MAPADPRTAARLVRLSADPPRRIRHFSSHVTKKNMLRSCALGRPFGLRGHALTQTLFFTLALHLWSLLRRTMSRAFFIPYVVCAFFAGWRRQRLDWFGMAWHGMGDMTEEEDTGKVFFLPCVLVYTHRILCDYCYYTTTSYRSRGHKSQDINNLFKKKKSPSPSFSCDTT
jgi:hypothetical protein